GLRVVLHREGASAGQRHAFDDVVVEADVGDLGGPEWGVEFLIQAAGGGREGEAVVLGGDRDLASLQVLHRHVGAAVAELQLVGVQAEGTAKELVAEADAEERDVGLEHLLDLLHRVVGGGRVTRAVGGEHALGLVLAQVALEGGELGVGWNDDGADAALGVLARRVGLNAHVVGEDGVLALPFRVDDIRLVGGDVRGQVRAAHRRLLLDLGDHLLVGAEGVAGEDARGDRALLAQVAYDGAGIHAADADDALCLELLVEAALGSPVADGVGEVADDQASGPDLAVAGLGVLVVPAGVTDLWGGEHRDLTVEG